MPAPQTIHSTRSAHHNLAGRVLNFANSSKPVVDIIFGDEAEDHHDAWFRSYATFDEIKGRVQVTAPHDTRFDEIQIALVGNTKTRIDQHSTASALNGRSEAFHQFLKLQQPISEVDYPTPRILEANKTYTFDFTFVVPDQLLPSSCRHRVSNSKVTDAHLALPPSLGDPELSGNGKTLLDDLCPEMVRIYYGVRARVVSYRERDGKEMLLSDRTKKVRVIPATDEHPPIDVDGKDDEYRLRCEKNVRKGMFKGKAGRIVMEAEQPMSLRLPHPNAANPCPPQTTVTVNLRFDPAEAMAQPPKLSTLKNRLKVGTFFASGPRADIPCKSKSGYDSSQGLFVEAVNLSSRNMSSAQWKRYEANERLEDAAEHVKPSRDHDAKRPHYTAKLVVPITLPQDKAFVPTFHSCIVSRVYILDMNLNVTTGSSAGVSSDVSLKIPVQISADAADERYPHPRHQSVDMSQAIAIASAALDDYTAPPPEDEYYGTSPTRSNSASSASDDLGLDDDTELPAPPPEYAGHHIHARTGGAGRSMRTVMASRFHQLNMVR